MSALLRADSTFLVARSLHQMIRSPKTRLVVDALAHRAAFRAHTRAWASSLVRVEPGEVLFAQRELARFAGVTHRQLRTALGQLERQGIISTEIIVEHKRAIGTRVTVKYLRDFYLSEKSDTPNDTPNRLQRRGFPGESDTPTDTVRTREIEKEFSTLDAPPAPSKLEKDHMSPIPIKRAKHRMPPRDKNFVEANGLIARTFDRYVPHNALVSFTEDMLKSYRIETIREAFNEIVARAGGLEGGKSWVNRNGFITVCEDVIKRRELSEQD